MDTINVRKKLIKRIISMIVIIALVVTAISLISYLPVQVGNYRWTPLSIGMLIMGIGLIASAFFYEFRDEVSIKNK